MNEAVAALDEAGDAAKASLDLASHLLAVADAMDSQYLLRRSLSEPNATTEQLMHLVDTLFGNSVLADAVDIVKVAVQQSWPSAEALAAAIRDEAIRVAWRAAISSRAVEPARREVLALVDIIAGDQALATAVGDTSRDLVDRQALVAALVVKAKPVVALLASCAVADQRDTFAANLSGSLDCLASLRGHLRAHVTTAVAMTADQASAMEAQLRRIYGRPIDLETTIDARVVGGVRADVGGDVIDGSVRARLNIAREQLADIRIEATPASEENQHA